MFLADEAFKIVVRSTPLISIDFIIQDNKDQVLLGKRVNRPAKDFWFVPGGRIQKDETIADAFQRISQNELGLACQLEESYFLGLFQHFYQDNFSEDKFSTHYIVLGYKIYINMDLPSLPLDQHAGYRWFKVEELLSLDNVHNNTKAYFE